MRRYGPWLAAALVVLSNLAAWRVAALNRLGEPEAVLVLTERELQLPAKQAENTALTLALVFEPPRPRGAGGPHEAGWFDRAKLQSIGFDCRRPVAAENADYYRTRPPRATYAALEYEGARWLKQLGQAPRTPQPPSSFTVPESAVQNGVVRVAPRDPFLDSHLIPIDVDNDPAALRARHPDTRAVAVVEATVALQYVSNAGRPPFLTGRVTSVLPPEINVPREWRGALVALQSDEEPGVWPPPQHEPRFRVTVSWGKRLEPWITNVELLTPKPAR
jgi:hypothetical protein